MRSVTILLAMAGFMAVNAGNAREVRYRSTADNSEQPAMFHAPASERPVPLVVALHSWSGNYRQNNHKEIEQWCARIGWAYIHPDFRGPNNRPEATGSEWVVLDVLSAVEYAKRTTRIDDAAIYLVGTSGGGYTALLMAGRHPEVWAGVSAWVPISDLTSWYRECKQAKRRYFADIAASCGGAPGDSPTVDEQYRKRSPLTYLKNAGGLNLHVNAGIRDGHNGSVPISHSLRAFNEVAAPEDRLSEEEILFFVEKADVPENLKMEITDLSYGNRTPLFRRTSRNATLTVFQGGHELVAPAAIAWFEQIHELRGSP